MSIFKKKETKKTCCQGGPKVFNQTPSTTPQSQSKDQLSVKVLGSGCAKCNKLEQATLEALQELGISAQVDHVTDFKDIAAYGVMSTPALVINETVVSSGTLLSKQQVMTIVQKIQSSL